MFCCFCKHDIQVFGNYGLVSVVMSSWGHDIYWLSVLYSTASWPKTISGTAWQLSSSAFSWVLVKPLEAQLPIPRYLFLGPYMDVSINRDPKIDPPLYYDPHYKDSQKGPQIFKTPHIAYYIVDNPRTYNTGNWAGAAREACVTCQCSAVLVVTAPKPPPPLRWQPKDHRPQHQI